MTDQKEFSKGVIWSTHFTICLDLCISCSLPNPWNTMLILAAQLFWICRMGLIMFTYPVSICTDTLEQKYKFLARCSVSQKPPDSNKPPLWISLVFACGMHVLHPKSIPRLAELGDCTMGCRTLASPLIRSVHYHDYSVHPSVPEFRFPLHFMFPIFALFHVSVLIRIFRSVLFSIPKPDPRP